MKYKNLLEEKLRDIHTAEFPMVLDDDLPDHFDNWVSELDPNYIIDVWGSVQADLIEMLKDVQGDLDRAGIVINEGVYVADVPDGLSAELTGMKKGWRASIDVVLERIKSATVAPTKTDKQTEV